VIDGVAQVYPDLPEQLHADPDIVVHGAIFHPDRVEFSGGAEVFTGNLSASVAIRNHKPSHFLSKLIWIERRRVQVFEHDLGQPGVPTDLLLGDKNAFLLRLKDRWLLDLYKVWATEPSSLSTAIPAAHRL